VPSPRADRRVLVSLAVQFFVNGFVWATFVSRLPAVRDRVGISIGVLGLVLMIGNASSLLGSLFTDRVVARMTSRRVMIVGGLLYVAALPIIGWSTSAGVLVVGLIVLMWFDVFIDVSMNLQASVVSARRASPVMNRLAGMWSLGTATGGIVAALAAGAGIGPLPHYVATALVLAVAVLVVAPGLLRTDDAHPERQVSDMFDTHRWWRVGRTALALGTASAMAVALDVTSGDWATFRLVDDLDAGPRVAIGAFIAFTAGMTIGRFGGDWVSVRVGRTALTKGGATIGAVGLAIATLVPDQAVAVAGFLIAGLGTSVLAPQLADAAAWAPGRPGAGFKVLFVGHRVAALLTPLAIGGLADTSHFGVGAAMAIVGIPAAVVVFAVSTIAINEPR
jgi:MFS family permease